MGRLDDAAKHKVVELRKAGLSFRKIKAVLELENIKVSAQAIYLFLREFQGRPPGRVRPVEAGGSKTTAQVQPQAGSVQESWKTIRLQNLIREASHHAGFTAAADFAQQSSTNPEASAKPSGYGETSGGSRLEQQHEGDKDENEIQIVSVTSLAQNSQERDLQSSVTRAETGTVSSTLTGTGAFMRRRVTPSPATNSMLAARKRLLDKALSHRVKSYHQMASLLRRDHSSVQGSDLRSVMPQQPETYDLTTEKTVMDAQPGGGGGAPRRFLTQRPGLSVRSPHPPPRVGIRLPNRPPAALTSSAPGGAVIRLQTPGSQGATRSEGNPSPQDTGGRGGLQEQIHTLGSEVRSLGLAVKMLVEQQCRLEREQSQQTHIQKQILSTLQSLASKLGQCSASQQQQNKTPSPSALPTPSASTSFSQDTFSFMATDSTQLMRWGGEGEAHNWCQVQVILCNSRWRSEAKALEKRDLQDISHIKKRAVESLEIHLKQVTKQGKRFRSWRLSLVFPGAEGGEKEVEDQQAQNGPQQGCDESPESADALQLNDKQQDNEDCSLN
ncbi:hypothetical protein INR49_018132 [Caranx melampygus]|nr:hypothetical protein INR49_018132 [Caranx melampygus]